MKMQKKLKKLAALILFFGLLFQFQNCAEIHLRAPDSATVDKKPMIVTTTTFIPIAPSPSPMPQPTPLPPVITDDGIPNPSPLLITHMSGIGLAPQSIYMNGYWIVVGNLRGGAGTGGMWIMKEDGTVLPSTGTSVKTIDICTTLVASYMAANGLLPPNCKFRNSLDNTTVQADGHNLYKINDSEFLFLMNIKGETQTDPLIQGCARTAALRLKLTTSPLYVTIQSAAVGCFTAMTVLKNQEVLLTGQLDRDSEPHMIHSYNLSDLSYIRSVPLPPGMRFSGAFTFNNFAMNKFVPTPQSLIVKQTSSGILEYINTNENLSVGWATDDPLLMAAYTSSQPELPSTLKFYRETAPGELMLERAESIPANPIGRNRQGFHYVQMYNGEWAFNRGSYIKIGARPGVEAPRYDMNPGDVEVLTEVNISPNGYIIFIYYREIHLAKIQLN